MSIQNNIELKNVRSIVLVCVWLLSSSFLPAADLTLEQAIFEYRSSPRMQKSESIKNEAYWKKSQSLTGFLPEITLKSFHVFHQKYVFADIVMGGAKTSIPNLAPATVYDLNFQLPIFDGLANVNRLSSAVHNELGTIAEHDWNQFQGEREISLLFYKAIAAEELKKVSEQNFKILIDHLADIQMFKAAGLSTKYDVLRVEVQKSEAESEILNSKDNAQSAREKLNEVLGLTSNDERAFIGSLPLYPKSIVEKINLVTDDRLDLKSLREKVISMDEMNRSDSKYYLPKINLFADYQYYNNRNYDLLGNDNFRNAYNFGVQLTWTIFDGMKSISKDRISFEQKIQLEKTLRMSEVKARSEVAFWKRKFTYYVDVYHARLNDIEKAEESVRLAKIGRKVGTRTNTDLLDAEGELFRAKAASINAQIGHIEALINLEIALGKEIITI